MAGPSTEFMRGLERDYEILVAYDIMEADAGRAPAASGSTQESVIEAAIPQDQRGCETTSNWWPSPVIASLMAMNGGGSALRMGTAPDPGGRTTETASPSPRPCAPDLRSRASPLPQAHRQCATRAHADILDIRDAVLVRSTVPWVTFVLAMRESVLQQI